MNFKHNLTFSKTHVSLDAIPTDNKHMIRVAAFPTRLHVRTAKTQINLASEQSDQSSLRRVAEDPKRFKEDSKESDQTARMRRQIYVFTERTCNLVGNRAPNLYVCTLWTQNKIVLWLFVTRACLRNYFPTRPTENLNVKSYKLKP